MLGNGWYKGRFGYWGEGKDTEIYGDRFLLSAELEITYEDGSRDILCTDESWNCMESPVKSSGIYDGEVYDGRIRLWDEQGRCFPLLQHRPFRRRQLSRPKEGWRRE